MKASIIERLVRSNIRTLKPYQSARGTATAAEDLLLLDAAENPYSPFEGEAEFPELLNRYPEPQPIALRERLAELYGVEREQIVLTRGSEEGIRLILQVFCTPAKDAILICPPTFGLYPIEAAIHDVRMVKIPRLGEDAALLDSAAIVRAAQDPDSGIKMVFICNPGNPASTSLPVQQIEDLLQDLVETCMVVIDEAYIEFAGHTSFVRLLSKYPNLIVLRTLSKSFGLAGLRCGAIIGSSEITRYLRSLIAAYPVPRSTCSLALAALEPERIKRMQDYQSRIKSERSRLYPLLTECSGVTRVLPSDTNFFCVIVAKPEQAVRTFFEAGILVRDRSAAIPGALSIAIGTPEQNDQVLAVCKTL